MIELGFLFMAGIAVAALIGVGGEDAPDVEDEHDEDDETPSGVVDPLNPGDEPDSCQHSSGGSGNDTLPDGTGNDLIEGEDGDDLIAGFANAYEIIGGSYTFDDLQSDGDDTLYGGNGNDTLGVSDGDEAYGGEGADDFVVYHNELSDPAEMPIIRDYDPDDGDEIKIVIDAALPSHDAALGEYVGNGEFEYSADVQIQMIEAENRSIILINGAPVASVDGLHPDLVDNIIVRGFLL